MKYRLDGRMHRVNGPASIWDDESKWVWWLRGRWHRYYGPCSSYGCWCIQGRLVK